MLSFTSGWGRNMFCFFQTAETGKRTPNSGVQGSGANHYAHTHHPAQSGQIVRLPVADNLIDEDDTHTM